MRVSLPILALLAVIISPLGAAQAEGSVNVYSYRQPFLVQPLFDKFTAQTGIEVKTIFAKKGLIERAKAEGMRSPADIILTVDIGRLQQARTIAQAVNSPILQRHIPANARGKDNKWFGLTWRARIAYASKTRVTEKTLSFTDLTAEKWRGRICLRSGQHPYNIALFAALIDHMGEADFKDWLRGLKANLASKPSGNDRAQVRRVFGGACDIAIGNTYYMGKMQTNEKKPEQKQWAEAVSLIFPDMPRGGAHMNVSGMAMAKHAPNRANAQKLMEFLVSRDAQEIYAEVNFEYPVRQDVPASNRVKAWGVFTADSIDLDRIAALRSRASEIVDEVGFNQGP